MAFKAGDRVQVVEAMRARFWDLAGRAGRVRAIDGAWPIIDWTGLADQTRIDPAYLEVFDADPG